MVKGSGGLFYCPRNPFFLGSEQPLQTKLHSKGTGRQEVIYDKKGTQIRQDNRIYRILLGFPAF